MLTRAEILRRRLANQHLTAPTLDSAAALVSRLGAVQSQDYAGAKWGIAQRTRGVADAGVDRAMAEGAIVRTHVLRPTWHFVAAADVRWMLELTAPRIRATMAPYDRVLGLDESVFRRSNAAIAKALRGGKQLTRGELGEALERAGIASPRLQRLGHLVSRAELDALICSGGRRGKQFTYALLDECVPPAKPLARADALREIARRFFGTRGPATVRDFSWWSGLTAGDARTALAAVEDELACETADDGRTYWFPPETASAGGAAPVYLLPNYDEYTVAYRDREAIVDPRAAPPIGPRDDNPIFANVVVVNGQVAGTWTRATRKRGVAVAVTPARRLTTAERRGLAEAVERYAAFLDTPAELVLPA
jgi:hypothetical protein